MTDVSPAICEAAPWATMDVEWANRTRLAEEAMPANKTALFDALATAGITRVVIVFDGAGDSGQIEDV